MPEEPRPSPPPDRRVPRNLFVDADPDLVALAQPAVDGPARSAAGRRRGRGLVVLAEHHRSPDGAGAHDAERFTRPDGNVARWRAAARHGLRQADAAAGRLLRALAARPYRGLMTIVALAMLLIAFGGLVLGAGETSTARVAADGQRARNATRLRYEEGRIEALTAEVRRLEQGASPTEASTAPAGRTRVPRQPAVPQAAGRYDRPR
jgi:hypothetical protein